jgi:UDPglucose 6-dehydrogenase
MSYDIGMIGIGKLGKPVLEFFEETLNKDKNISKCYGYDIISNISSDNFETVNSIDELCNKNVDIIFIAVPTPHDKSYDGSIPTSQLPCKNFDTSIVKNVLIELSKYRNESQTIVLISTVLPGTIREEFSEYIPDLIYNPYFIAMGSVRFDMKYPEMIVIGVDEKCENIDHLSRLLKFYDILYNDEFRIVLCTWEEAECIKVFYNTFISTKIAFVNMIQDFSQKIGNIDATFVTGTLSESTNRLISNKYMNPGMGDGGPCHPRDNIALSYLSEKYNIGYDFFGSIMSIREKQSENVAKILINKLTTDKLDGIIINGKTYKEGVPLTDGSSSLLIGYYCEKLGYTPIFIDPLVNDNIEFNKNKKYVILLAHKELYFKPTKGSIVLDIWNDCNSIIIE